MAVIVTPGVQSSPSLPSTEELLQQLRGQLTLADVADSPDQSRYAVSSVDAANMPLLQGVQPVAGLPWPSSAGVTQFNGRTGAVSVGQLAGAGPAYTVGVSTPGSGVQVGDQRNLKAVTAANYQSGWSGATITYTSTPTTATIAVTAATLFLGSISVGYNAASVPVTGTANTTVLFFLYYIDPNYSGGTQTLHASTDPHTVVTNDGYVNLGQVSVTFPATGTGGGGGTGGCPCVDAQVIRRGWFGLQRKMRAGKVRTGDRLRLIDGSWGRVSASTREWQPCRRIETALGSLCCSASAPLLLTDGEIVPAGDVAVGAWLKTDSGLARVTSNVTVGDGAVQRITCENAFFWCRSHGKAWFAHHNMKPPG